MMREHPLRNELIDEIHARSFHDFSGLGRFIRYIYLTPDDDSECFDYINEYLSSHGKPKISDNQKFLRVEFGEFAIRIERHTEFFTISFLDKEQPDKRGLAEGAFDPSALPYLPFDWINEMPCDVFHAIWLEVGGKPISLLSQVEAKLLLKSRAAPANLISDKSAQLYLGFDRDDNGFTRAVIFNITLAPIRMGRVVQRVVEMETYRFIAMMGLAIVKEHSPTVSKLDKSFNKLTNDISTTINTPDADMRILLKHYSTISATLEQTSSDTSYRLAATKAYRDVFLARLHALRPTYLDGHQGLIGFTDRRMMPAMQTCEAFSARLERLSKRSVRVGQLIQTETESKIQEQNRDLLVSMDRRARTQLRLQQTVEGFSIVALTYYGVGLVHYLAKGLPLAEWGVTSGMINALSVPIIGITVFTLIRETSKRLREQDSN